jgi:choline kinase
MVPFLGRPLVQHQLKVLQACGIDDVSFVTGYRSDVIETLGFTSIRNDYYAQTNMVASMFTSGNSFDGSDDLVVCYSDIVYEKPVLETLISHESSIATAIDVKKWLPLWSQRMDNPLSDLETVKFHKDGTLAELGKKPKELGDIEGQFMGLIKFAANIQGDLLDFYRSMDRTALFDGQTFDNMYMTSFLQALISSGRPVAGAKSRAGWLEIDSISDLEVYERLERRGELADYWQQEP